jgi:hypothetical protein
MLHYTVPKIRLIYSRNKTVRLVVPNSYIHVSVRNLYIHRVGCLFGCSKIGRPILGIYSINPSQIHECGDWETEHYNSVIIIILGIHKSEPDICMDSHRPFNIQTLEPRIHFHLNLGAEDQPLFYVLHITIQALIQRTQKL